MEIEIFATEGSNEISTYQSAINFACKPMLEANAIAVGFSQACIDREKQFPTGLKINDKVGIAIPHGNSSLVKKSGISFVRLVKPVNFGLMEDATQKVECSFLFNLALAEGDQHLTTLRKLMKLFQSKQFIQDIEQLPNNQLVSYLKKSLD